MKKIHLFGILFLALILMASSVSAGKLAKLVITPEKGDAVAQQSEGLIDNSAGNSDFTNPARVSINVDHGVIYITVIAGNGRIINVIKEVRMNHP